MAFGRRRPSLLVRTLRSSATKLVVASAVLAGGMILSAKLAASRAASPPERKKRFRLEADETPKQGVSRVARGELDMTIGLLGAGPNGDGGAEAVHEARKALKRLRALLRVSRPGLDEDGYQREKVVFRDAGRELSGARDAQVLLDTLDSLSERFAEDVPKGYWSRLRDELATGAARAQAGGPESYDGVLDALSQARMRVSSWPLPSENGRVSLAQGFDRIYRRGRRALRRAKAHPTPENLHELRKRAKDLWHAAQLLEPVCPAKMKRTAKAAHRLSDLLGDDHDLSVLRDFADQHPQLLDDGERELLHTVIDLRRHTLRRQALDHAGGLYQTKPVWMLRQLALI